MSATVYRRSFVRHPKRRWIGGNFFQSFRGRFDEPSSSGGAGPDTVEATVLTYGSGSPNGGAGAVVDHSLVYDAPSPRFG